MRHSLICMLTGHVILQTRTISAADVCCMHEPWDWSSPEPVQLRRLILVRSGMFRRRVGRQESLLDSSTGYLSTPGTDQSFAHPAGGDRCTSITLTEQEFTATLAGRLPDIGVVGTTLEIDIAHRALLARARAGATQDELVERTHVLVGKVLVGSALTTTDHADRPQSCRRVVDHVRELLAADRSMPLDELARRTGRSAFHLSRAFRRTTGMTITAYRIRLKLRDALDQLASGETDLATLAAETGFSDQAHLTRLLKREAGATPGRLRWAFANGG